MSYDSTILAKLKKYGAGGYYLRPIEDIYALINHIATLEEAVDYLQEEVREKDAWEGRYNALLEECEANRPPEIDGGEASRGAASMTVALDANGFPWLCDEGGWWRLVKDVIQGKRSELHPLLSPYTIVYTPKENANE